MASALSRIKVMFRLIQVRLGKLTGRAGIRGLPVRTDLIPPK